MALSICYKCIFSVKRQQLNKNQLRLTNAALVVIIVIVGNECSSVNESNELAGVLSVGPCCVSDNVCVFVRVE